MKTAKLIIEGKEITVQISEEELGKIEKKDRPASKYFFVAYDGPAAETTDLKLLSDDWRYLTGNYFKTREQAEAYRDFRRALGEIKQYISENFGEFKPDWSDQDQRKFFITYDADNKKWNTESIRWTFRFPILPYLAKESDIDELIASCSSQLEIIREYISTNNY